MISITHIDWDQCYIMNKIMILTKRGTDTIYTVFPGKYQKYSSTTILKHANILAKVNKFPYGHLPNMMRHDAHSITIHIHTMTLEDISHKIKKE